MSKEDELAQALIEQTDPEEYWVEVPYNHYGSRGVVDLVLFDELFEQYRCIELKSPEAVDTATGANEILRQFNRQQEYFGEGSSLKIPYNATVSHELVFYATEKTAQHVHDNITLYESAGKVHLRHPDTRTPIVVSRGALEPSQDDMLNQIVDGVEQ